ncbi:DUF4382 domain-containing protein [Chloroflexota bacterium]
MKRHTLALPLIVCFIASMMFAGCSGDGEEVGTLQFRANGEDFVRQGFVSKDGWSIEFDHVYLCLVDVSAYRIDPPYDPHTDSDIDADVEIELTGVHTIDLAEGGENAEPILVGQVEDAETGHYNAVSWKMVKGESGPLEGYCLVIMGTAEKDGRTIDFTISVEEEYEYSGGEYVGDERKGIVQDGGMSDVEMTFHFDHIFGDGDIPVDDHLNIGAVGFAPFADIAEGSTVDEDMAGLRGKLSTEDYRILTDTLVTLGHVGEGHCHCIRL